MADIFFKSNLATAGDILKHFETCNTDFLENLTARVDLHAYTDKILLKAARYEAWSKDQLIGLLAVYHHEDRTSIDYITNLSISRTFQSKGIATTLMKDLFEQCRIRGTKELKLEVIKDNFKGQNFYRNLGFLQAGETDNTVFLSLSLPA